MQLERIREKLDALRRSDIEYQVFGASKHRYLLAPALTNSEMVEFEREFGVALPDDYAAFLTKLGNGGAGPWYGLYALSNSAEEFRSSQTFAGKQGTTLRLDQPFPLTGAVADALIASRRVGLSGNFDPHVATAFHLNGIMDICHQGCTGYEGLVMSGEQRGHVWGTGGPQYYRWGAQGYGPGSLKFLDWYEEWLDRELSPTEVERRLQAKANPTEA